jgi:hypothetical protein
VIPVVPQSPQVTRHDMERGLDGTPVTGPCNVEDVEHGRPIEAQCLTFGRTGHSYLHFFGEPNHRVAKFHESAVRAARTRIRMEQRAVLDDLLRVVAVCRSLQG